MCQPTPGEPAWLAPLVAQIARHCPSDELVEKSIRLAEAEREDLHQGHSRLRFHVAQMSRAWQQQNFPHQNKNCLLTAHFILSGDYFSTAPGDLGDLDKYLARLGGDWRRVDHVCRSELRHEYEQTFGMSPARDLDDADFWASVEKTPSILMLEHLDDKGTLKSNEEGLGVLHAIACVGHLKVDPRDALVDVVSARAYRQSRKRAPRMFAACVFPETLMEFCEDRLWAGIAAARRS